VRLGEDVKRFVIQSARKRYSFGWFNRSGCLFFVAPFPLRRMHLVCNITVLNSHRMSLDDETIELRIPISAIFEEFVCPICLSAVTDCYITPCGHNGCNECLQEWISRKHSCPVCVAPNITIGTLVKNLAFDNVYRKVCCRLLPMTCRRFLR
jgi:hypothetical protein